MSVMYLPEISEDEATGDVAVIYDDIRSTMGLPLVNLIWRHLAIERGRLEAIWHQLRPNIVHSATDSAVSQLQRHQASGVIRIPFSALQVAGADTVFARHARVTIDAYNFSNPRNLLCMYALLNGCEGSRERSDSAPAPRQYLAADTLLPMADLQTLDGDTRVLLEDMSRQFASPGETVLIPSLFRHFAPYPRLLALLWIAVQPCFDNDTFAQSVTAITELAPELAQSLPFPLHRIEDASTRTVLQRFTQTVPGMIVAGRMLQQALDYVLEHD